MIRHRLSFGAVSSLLLVGGSFVSQAPAAATALNIVTGHAYKGTYSLRLDTDGTPGFLQSNDPITEASYRVRFYVDFSRLNLVNGTSFVLFDAYSGTDPLPSQPPSGDSVLRVQLRQEASGKFFDVFTRTDPGTEAQVAPSPSVSGIGWNAIELQWSASTGANDGLVNVWVNGVAQTGLSGLDSDLQRINYIRLGNVTGATVGAPPDGGNRFWIDEFGSRDTGYLGQVQAFGDVPLSDPFARFTYGLYSAGVTKGCGGGNYCPAVAVPREQMAAFLERGMRGQWFVPPAATGIFADVPLVNGFAPLIEQLFNDGVTSGCGTSPALFCPSAPVTRAQMAIFLLRARHGAAYIPPPATGTVFADVPAGAFGAAFIEQLAAEGITTGCGGGNYCPNDPVTRGQMSVFLVRTFSLATQELGPIAPPAPDDLASAWLRTLAFNFHSSFESGDASEWSGVGPARVSALEIDAFLDESE